MTILKAAGAALAVVVCNCAHAGLSGSLYCSVAIPVFLGSTTSNDSCASSIVESLKMLSDNDVVSVSGTRDDLGIFIRSEASASLLAEYGHLQATALSQVRIAAGSVGGSATAGARASFADEILVFSSSLPTGTPVSLSFLYTLEFNNNYNLISDNTAANGRFRYDITSGYGLFGSQGSLVHGQVNNTFSSDYGEIGYPETVFIKDDPFAIDFSYQTTIKTFVGDTLTISGNLFTRAESLSELPYGENSSYLGYSESLAGKGANFYLNVQNIGASNISKVTSAPDVTLVAASGHSYALPVPEPASYVMLITGLCVLRLTKRGTHIRAALRFARIQRHPLRLQA